MFVQQTLKNEQPQKDLFTLILVDTVSCLDAHFSVFQTICKEMGVPHTAIFINSIITVPQLEVFNSEALLCQQIVCVGFYFSIFRQLLPSVGAELPVQVTVCVQGTAQPLLQGENSSRPRSPGMVDAGLVGYKISWKLRSVCTGVFMA